VPAAGATAKLGEHRGMVIVEGRPERLELIKVG
jgi:hypothetical protein